MEGYKKTSQVVGTTSEVQLVECKRCGFTISKSNNYCSYCRKPNNPEIKTSELDRKLALIALALSVITLFITLSN